MGFKTRVTKLRISILMQSDEEIPRRFLRCNFWLKIGEPVLNAQIWGMAMLLQSLKGCKLWRAYEFGSVLFIEILVPEEVTYSWAARSEWRYVADAKNTCQVQIEDGNVWHAVLICVRVIGVWEGSWSRWVFGSRRGHSWVARILKWRLIPSMTHINLLLRVGNGKDDMQPLEAQPV